MSLQNGATIVGEVQNLLRFGQMKWRHPWFKASGKKWKTKKKHPHLFAVGLFAFFVLLCFVCFWFGVVWVCFVLFFCFVLLCSRVVCFVLLCFDWLFLSFCLFPPFLSFLFLVVAIYLKRLQKIRCFQVS